MVRKVNVTVDDVSPLIDYSPRGAWYDGDARDGRWDSLAYNGTFMVTGQAGSTATLTFNGTSVWLYGSKGKGNGAYNVTLDGSSSADNGFSDRDLFQQVLFAATGLDGNKTHRLTVENVGTNGTNLVIDSIVHEVEVPDDYQDSREQDLSSSFEYSTSAWSIDLGDYDGHTEHTTSQEDAYVVYDFEVRRVIFDLSTFVELTAGPSRVIHFRQVASRILVVEAELGPDVEIYGVIGPNGGLYTAQVDDGSSTIFNASSAYLTPQTLLYRCTGLSPGPHKVRIANTPFHGQTLGIDYAVVRRPPSTDGDPTPGHGPSHSTLSGSMIGGIAAGIAVGTLLVLFGAFVWYRRLRKRGKSSEGEVKVSKSEYPYVNVDYGTGPVPHHTPSLPPLPLPSPSPPASPSPSHVVSVSPTETESLSLRGGLTLSSTNSRTRLVLHDHDFGSEAGPSELGHSVSEVGGSESMKSVAVPTFYPPVTPFGEDSIWRNSGQSSSRPLPRPQTASGDDHHLHTTQHHETDLRNTRMWVQGRVQDFGPAPAFVATSDHNFALDDPEDLLPPDYDQATEPFTLPVSGSGSVTLAPMDLPPPPFVSQPLPVPPSPPPPVCGR